MEQYKKVMEIKADLITNVFGKLDENIKILEKHFKVKIINRGEDIIIVGDKEVDKAYEILCKMVLFAEKGEELKTQNVTYLISSVSTPEFNEIEKINDEHICLTASGRPIKPKTIGQKKYIEQMKKNTVVFGVGPAGTGKTYLAMAMAITAFKKEEVSRIILTRPAIEAGENLGFLPGDLQQKVDPYLRPLYDALHEIMGADKFHLNMEKGLIEVAPLAYMRGRTLDNAFIVLDEAQNTTPEQMKMFLTRIGFGSKAVITGDVTQIDLPKGKNSGLVDALNILSEVEGIDISMLSAKDIVRHPLVQKIVDAYEKKETKDKQKKQKIANKTNRGN